MRAHSSAILPKGMGPLTFLRTAFLAFAALSSASGESNDGTSERKPAPVKETTLKTGAAFKETARLPRHSGLVDLFIGEGGTEVYVLDLSSCTVLQLDAATLAVKKEVFVGDFASAMCLTPNRKSIWVGGRSPRLDDAGRTEWGGWAKCFSVPDLVEKSKKSLQFPLDELAANDSGLLIYTSTDSQFMRLFDTAKGADAGFSEAGRTLKIHPSQRALYYWNPGGDSVMGLPFAAIPVNKAPVWRCAKGESGWPGDIAFSPDGKWVVATGGIAATVECHKDRDAKKVVRMDSCLSFAVAPGRTTFFTCTVDGVLREYEFGEFVRKRDVNIGFPMRFMAVDPEKKVLFGVAVKKLPDMGGWKKRIHAGDVVAISLEPK